MRLVLTHSAQHSAPKRPRPIHSDANHPTWRDRFSASSVPEWSRPSASLRREASWTAFRSTQAFASLHPSTSSASLNPTATPPPSENSLLDKATNLCFNKLMHKGTFIKRVTQKNQKPQVTQQLYNKVLTDLLTTIRQELAAGRKVSFLGFGTFYTRIHKGGRGRNFKTNKPMEYKAVRIPAFRPGSLLKQAVRKKK